MSLKDNLTDDLEPFDNHLDCVVELHTNTEETFRVYVDEDKVSIGKNLHYEIIESAFFCTDHSIYIESPDDYEWDI